MSTIALIGAVKGMNMQDRIIFWSPMVLLVLMQIKPIKCFLSGKKEREQGDK